MTAIGRVTLATVLGASLFLAPVLIRQAEARGASTSAAKPLDSVRLVPRLPRVRAHIEGRWVIGDYGFATWPSDPRTRPWQLLISSVSSDSRYSPLTYEVYPKRRVGSIRQHLTLGHGPYKLLISVRNRFGARSRVISMPLHR
jgi:hypothetical protein